MAAITLNIELTDQQRAILVEVAPGATDAEKRAWAEDIAKKALRHEVSVLRRAKLTADAWAQAQAAADAAEAARLAAEAALETDWPG